MHRDTDQCTEEREKIFTTERKISNEEEKVFFVDFKNKFSSFLSPHSLLACCHLSFISFVFFRAF